MSSERLEFSSYSSFVVVGPRLDCNIWCISTTRSTVLLKRHRCKRSQNEVRGGQARCGFRLGILSNTTDPVALKQNPSGLQICPPCFTSIFVCTTVLASGCSTSAQCFTSVTLASALLHIFMLCFPSPLCLSGHQETDFAFLSVEESNALG